MKVVIQEVSEHSPCYTTFGLGCRLGLMSTFGLGVGLGLVCVMVKA